MPATAPELLTVREVAALLGCSPRHVYRLSADGRMPAPVSLGALVRWNRNSVQSWIEGGCQPVREASTAERQEACRA